ncbi:hypothetical protein RJ639_013680 [Escallonia herrerae]|uniref:Uncharacterized protein n=1 Tax=Escallonia herrerae TaxID=1293975 RepID=A0AA88VF87_9ASTE|nr:hypothetical protein RJ639_013680 [Escallonia herrerae]
MDIIRYKSLLAPLCLALGSHAACMRAKRESIPQQLAAPNAVTIPFIVHPSTSPSMADSTASNRKPTAESNIKRDGDSDYSSPVSKKLRMEAQKLEQDLNEVCYIIEADAADDKASRHTMEDAWVEAVKEAHGHEEDKDAAVARTEKSPGVAVFRAGLKAWGPESYLSEIVGVWE